MERRSALAAVEGLWVSWVIRVSCVSRVRGVSDCCCTPHPRGLASGSGLSVSLHQRLEQDLWNYAAIKQLVITPNVFYINDAYFNKLRCI